MIIRLRNALMTVMLLLTSHVMYGQAPNLGAASDFAVFTAAGEFNVAGASTSVTGDVGTNVGAFNGFPPGVLVGQVHVADAVSTAAATDLATAYGSLSTVTCGQVIPVTMGNGQVLTPDVYCTGAASTINGDLILDAQNDPSAIFIFKIGGALATTVSSSITLVNGASLCNVYWQINGQVDLGGNSVFRGIMLVNGAINLLDGATLMGQALSQAGAISLQNNLVTIGAPPVASTIMANGATSFCIGESVVLSGNVGGTWNTGAVSASITVSNSGDFFVTNTNSCGSVASNTITVTVNPLPVCSITGSNTTCPGEPTQLCAPDGLASYLWSTGETSSCISVNSTGTFSVTITDANGCVSFCSHNMTFVCNPVITPVDPVVLSTCNAELPMLSTSWTDCSTSGNIIGVPVLQGTNGCVETYLYTFSGIDACGDPFSTQTTVTRTVDDADPVIMPVADYQIAVCNADWPSVLSTSWSDNCAAGGMVDATAGPVMINNCGESRVYTFLVTDDCGNSAMTTTTVTRVVDDAAPVIMPVADYQIAVCNADWPSVLSTSWNDNCAAGGMVDATAGPVMVNNCGESRVYTFLVTDDCGNSAMTTTTVTRVVDDADPVIMPVADYQIVGCNADWPAVLSTSWSDNCAAGGMVDA
ncbi:MAG: ice-binding family protein, partial [Phaeodactylibacter sp.]|uniref:ice-binding family protein n=1 Tax=Phaeodactylibacter sp. TaxID=1940289 RepID=UPI0032EDC5BF